MVLEFKDHSQSIGSLFYTPIFKWEIHIVTNPCIHNGKQRPQQLERHMHALRKKQKNKGMHPE